MRIKDLSDAQKNLLKRKFEAHGFEFRDQKFSIVIKKGYRTFYLHNLNMKDPMFITTEIDIDLFLEKHYFMKTKQSKGYQDKRFNEGLDVDEIAEELNWEIKETYGIKDFDSNQTIEEPFAESMFQVIIKGNPHIIIDDNLYSGEAKAIISLIKPQAKEALLSLTSEDFLDTLLEE